MYYSQRDLVRSTPFQAQWTCCHEGDSSTNSEDAELGAKARAYGSKRAFLRFVKQRDRLALVSREGIVLRQTR
jgi:hypothetical protein